MAFVPPNEKRYDYSMLENAVFYFAVIVDGAAFQIALE
jgi:hypothetical protein